MPTLSAEVREELVAFYGRGMTRKGSPLVDEVARATGVEKCVIENWIGNYRRAVSGVSRKKRTTYKRSKSAYNLFCADILKGKGDLTVLKDRWKYLGEAERDRYEKKAEELSRNEGPLTEEVRQRKLKDILNILKVQMSNLEQLGVEASVLMLDKTQPGSNVNCLGTNGAQPFLKTSVLSDFCVSVAANATTSTQSTATQKDRKDRKVLIAAVQELFNIKYQEAGGIGRLPYTAVEAGKTVVSIVGAVAVLRRPSSYGNRQLSEILAVAKDFSFVLNEVPTRTPEEMFLSMMK